MINFIRTNKKGHILGLFLLSVSAILAGCTARAETTRQQPAPPKREVAAQRTPDDDIRMTRNPYAEMPQDGDMEYSAPAPQKNAPANLSKSAFEKIKLGMTLGEVEKILGDKGMLVATMDVNGRKTRTYKWSNDNFTSYIDVVIENERVTEKKDKGLK
ncbi:MAG TPA: hypothetical protein VGC97_13150 [Pyrinomonadaceae bacterium]|jgi:hypothetical protein